MKGKDQVIQEFNDLVNMSASELERWLKSDDSNSAGWPKEDENGETVGHDSGRKIVEILKENPEKEAEKYTDEQVEHMRKVVSYCKRHLAQETKGNSEKSAEEVKKTKSYASLKNWGHDFLKAKGKEDNEKEEEEDDDDKQAGDKRKTTQNQSGPNKKRETAKGESETKDEEEEEEISEEDADEPKESKTSNGKSKNEKTSNDKDDSTPKKGPKKGETVSWKWGQGEPEGKVLDVKSEETSIKTKKGNEVTRKGDEEDPAVVIDTGKNKAIKKSHELNEK
ncbi:hypothetical protein NW759_009915 [Fusarium solani]|nr:hypothetical protein NW759_009915 [Fusarium solani]